MSGMFSEEGELIMNGQELREALETIKANAGRDTTGATERFLAAWTRIEAAGLKDWATRILLQEGDKMIDRVMKGFNS